MAEATCAYGLAPDALGACVLTLASFCRTEYRTTQYLYTIFGSIALLAAAYKYWQAVRYSGRLCQWMDATSFLRSSLAVCN